MRQQREMLEHHAHLVAADARSARRRAPSADRLPSNSTLPEVGSISRDRQRSSVDLPEPDRPMTMKISPWRTSRSTRAHRADEPGLGELGRRRLAVCGAMKPAGVGAEDLPDVAAGELHRAGVRGRADCGAPAQRIVHASVLPESREAARPIVGRTAPFRSRAPIAPRPSTSPRWRRSRRPRLPRSSCRRGRPGRSAC